MLVIETWWFMNRLNFMKLLRYRMSSCFSGGTASLERGGVNVGSPGNSRIYRWTKGWVRFQMQGNIWKLDVFFFPRLFEVNHETIEQSNFFVPPFVPAQKMACGAVLRRHGDPCAGVSGLGVPWLSWWFHVISIFILQVQIHQCFHP